MKCKCLLVVFFGLILPICSQTNFYSNRFVNNEAMDDQTYNRAKYDESQNVLLHSKLMQPDRPDMLSMASQPVQVDAQCLCPVAEPTIKYIAVPMSKLSRNPSTNTLAPIPITTTTLPSTSATLLPPPPPPPTTTVSSTVPTTIDPIEKPCIHKHYSSKRQIITIQEIPIHTFTKDDDW